MKYIILALMVLASIALGWMFNESTDKDILQPYPVKVFVEVPAPEIEDVATPFYQSVMQKEQKRIAELESDNYWLAQKQELKFFQSMSEFYYWKAQYDYIDMEQRLLQSNQQFFDKSIPASVRCVPHAYGLMLLAADDGYILSVGQANNYTHWVNELVLGRLLYGIDPVTGYTYYTTFAADGK